MTNEIQHLERQIETNRDNVSAQVEKIRSYDELTPEAKRDRIQQVFEAGTAQHRQLLAQRDQAVQSRVQTLQDELYQMGTGGLTPGQIDARSASLRDALARAEQQADAGGTEGLLSYQRRCRMVGDKVGEHAAFILGSERMMESVVDEYLESRPYG